MDKMEFLLKNKCTLKKGITLIALIITIIVILILARCNNKSCIG